MSEISDLATLTSMLEPVSLRQVRSSEEGSSAIASVMNVLYGSSGTRIVSAETLMRELNDALINVGDAKNFIEKKLAVLTSVESAVGNWIGKKWELKGETMTSTMNLADESALVTTPVTFVLSDSAFVSPAIRGSTKVETFLNSMPPVVTTQMTPFFSLEVSMPDHEGAASMMRFLLGRVSDTPDGPSKQMLDGTRDEGTKITTSGMELFTSPQTLLAENVSSSPARYADVIDPLRPLATVENFSVSVSPTVGLFSFKKASLTLRLHDRSRLAEVAHLVRPLGYLDVTVWVTYGWRCPVAHDDPYASFVNESLLVREAYGVSNSSMSFDNFGQVSISLELFTKSGLDVLTKKIQDALSIFKENGESTSVSEMEDKLRETGQQIARYRRAAGIGLEGGLSKEIRSFQILEAAEQGTSLDLTEKDFKEAVAALKGFSFTGDLAQERTEALKNMKKALEKLGERQQTFKDRIKTAANSFIKEKFDAAVSGHDPFLSRLIDDPTVKERHLELSDLVSRARGLPTKAKKKLKNGQAAPHDLPKDKASQTVVSLGKVFALFIASSLLRTLEGGELQVFFYALNESASHAGGLNIASFPINWSTFRSQYALHVEKTMSENMTLDAFMGLVKDAQVEDFRSIAYGFSGFFKPYDETDPALTFKEDTNDQKFETMLSAAGNGKGAFKKPVLEFYIETVGINEEGTAIDALDQIDNLKSKASKMVTRIHVFDKQASPFGEQGKILYASNGEKVGFFEADPRASVDSEFVNGIDDIIGTADTAKQETLKKLQEGSKTRYWGIPPGTKGEDVKDIIARTMPTILFGANGTTIVGANLASKQDQLLGAIQMMGSRAGRPGTMSPNGAGLNGLPLRVIPAALTLTSLGCPLLSYGQQFFVDFSTGTSADNVYLVTGLAHNLTPGKFESQMTLTYYDGYGQWEGGRDVVAAFEHEIDELLSAT